MRSDTSYRPRLPLNGGSSRSFSDAAKLTRQADEKLALAQAKLVQWADGVLGRVVAQAPDQLAEVASSQAELRDPGAGPARAG